MDNRVGSRGGLGGPRLLMISWPLEVVDEKVSLGTGDGDETLLICRFELKLCKLGMLLVRDNGDEARASPLPL